jgi:hypothetical protein
MTGLLPKIPMASEKTSRAENVRFGDLEEEQPSKSLTHQKKVCAQMRIVHFAILLFPGLLKQSHSESAFRSGGRILMSLSRNP